MTRATLTTESDAKLRTHENGRGVIVLRAGGTGQYVTANLSSGATATGDGSPTADGDGDGGGEKPTDGGAAGPGAVGALGAFVVLGTFLAARAWWLPTGDVSLTLPVANHLRKSFRTVVIGCIVRVICPVRFDEVAERMSQCKSCNAFVTDAYARVFGDNDDVIDTCRNCRSSRGSIAKDSGAVGTVGVSGPNGSDDSDGADGTAGGPGATGARGATGPTGAPGVEGAKRAGSEDEKVLLRDVRDSSGDGEASVDGGDSPDDKASNRFKFGLSALRNAF